jgi:hypothetical protein
MPARRKKKRKFSVANHALSIKIWSPMSTIQKTAVQKKLSDLRAELALLEKQYKSALSRKRKEFEENSSKTVNIMEAVDDYANKILYICRTYNEERIALNHEIDGIVMFSGFNEE